MINKLLILAYSLSLYLVTVALVPLYCKYAFARGVLAIPNVRSSHEVITPRGGGIVFLGLWLITLVLGWLTGVFADPVLSIFLPGAFLSGLMGYWDDHRSLGARLRLVGQILVAVLVLYVLGPIDVLHPFGGGNYSFGWFGPIVGALGIIWSINLFNFMDGIDGVASTEAIFVLGFGGLIFWLSGVPSLALLSWALVISVSGFLVWNWPKATVFMGDVGSYVLGFAIGTFSLVGDVWYNIPISLWLILYAVFWFDATVTLFRRLYYKKHWATAHRDHAIQRLNKAGFSHLKILIVMIAVNSVLAALAMWGYFSPIYLSKALMLAVLWVVLWYIWVERLEPQRR